jgi:hypothetical protein
MAERSIRDVHRLIVKDAATIGADCLLSESL